MQERTHEKRVVEKDIDAALESEDECTCEKVIGICESSLHPKTMITIEDRDGRLHAGAIQT